MKKNNGISLITLVLIVAIMIILISVGTVLIIKMLDKNNDSANNNNVLTNNNEKTQVKHIIYLNNYKIILGETKIDDIINNTNLKVSLDDSDRYSAIDSKRSRYVELTDGTNKIYIESILGQPDIIKSIGTLDLITDPAFDLSTGTKITFVDNKFNKNISIGDSFTEYEFYHCDEITGTAMRDGHYIIVCQTEHLSNDYFGYYFDENYKIINMSADLDLLN